LAKAIIIRIKDPTFEQKILMLLEAYGLNSKQQLFQALVSEAYEREMDRAGIIRELKGFN